MLASLLNYINATGQIVVAWKDSVAIPIFKKGNSSIPTNFSPKSPIDIVYKLYIRYLLNRLIDWADARQIIAEEQAGFRKGRSTIDQCFTLQYLIHKSMNRPTKCLLCSIY